MGHLNMSSGNEFGHSQGTVKTAQRFGDSSSIDVCSA